LAVFDNTFIITSALQVLTAIVALTGILNAVTALLLERTREIGILRACGTLTGQVRQLLLHECFFYGLISGILAIPLGTALSWILIHIINQRSFGWTYDMVLTPGVFLQAIALSSAAALAAGIFPALSAGRTHIPTALHME
ncbi:MAG: ABC transporter permease, partial [Desulfobacteraceae bacterium]|nr:ABC transporter permease [Desulfobacteraceae bacterium]